jgi:hypothetical protein
VLAAAEAEIAQRAGDGLVLDVGGWACPLPRADWVLDVQPYATRGLYGPAPDPAAERFDETTWVVRDLCDREPWPFADGQFAFAVCAQTLEDVRDPVWACGELVRVARAGYVEVPTRLAEQSAGVEGDWPGWSHHHWFCDPEDGGIAFTFKHHVVHRPQNHLPAAFGAALAPEQRAWGFFWEGAFGARERILFDPAALEAELRATVDGARGRRRRWRRR